MNSFSDPDHLWNRVEVPFDDETRQLPSEAFESVAERVDSHAVVGAKGDVLLLDDGSHGWTLLAFPVEHGKDWLAVARQETGSLLDTSVVLEKVEFVRCIEFQSADEDDGRTTMHNVVFRVSVSDDEVIGEIQKQEDRVLSWFAGVPEEQEGDVADDIRQFVEN
ncbi:hypothetical protein ACOZ4B_12900 [Haloferax prahovense]|uniref:hypothetical protein n=1 Tax=Haloferax prahovense TaxID=381852 RepID=UPI003C71339E